MASYVRMSWEGDRLKVLRERQHLTQRELAVRVGVSTGLVSLWERGVRPKMDHIDKLAGALNTSSQVLTRDPYECDLL